MPASLVLLLTIFHLVLRSSCSGVIFFSIDGETTRSYLVALLPPALGLSA